ncbi:MAG: hypothetical protein HW387_207 [Parachlamydiales bacterium]|nr:hypothetical protein [Parachlamydiales bacterium]
MSCVIVDGQRVLISTLYIFRAACLAYLPSDVRPAVELGINLRRKGIVNPFLLKLTPQRANISRPSALKMYKVEMIAGVNNCAILRI